MGQFAQVAADGSLIGLFADSATTVPPSGYVAISAAIWSAWSASPRSTLVNGALQPPPPPPPPTLAQQAQAMLAAGIAITSTGTPALNGTYATNAQAQQNIQGVQTYIQANGKFPGSSGTYAWLDTSGAPHVFPSVAEFTAFATRVADFVADCTMIALTGSGTLPAATASIP